MTSIEFIKERIKVLPTTEADNIFNMLRDVQNGQFLELQGEEITAEAATEILQSFGK